MKIIITNCTLFLGIYEPYIPKFSGLKIKFKIFCVYLLQHKCAFYIAKTFVTINIKLAILFFNLSLTCLLALYYWWEHCPICVTSWISQHFHKILVTWLARWLLAYFGCTTTSLLWWVEPSKSRPVWMFKYCSCFEFSILIMSRVLFNWLNCSLFFLLFCYILSPPVDYLNTNILTVLTIVIKLNSMLLSFLL